MGALMRTHDWAATPLGRPEGWPQSLRAAVSIMLNSRYPIALYWGPNLALLYNDDWSPIPGGKHPWALGRAGQEVWPEIWDTIGPLFEGVLSTGEGVWQEDELLPMLRHGYVEECYFNFTFSPVRGEDGQIDGIFNAVVETTDRVLSERRLRTLSRMGERADTTLSVEAACTSAVGILVENAADAPFALVYVRHASEARLTAAAGPNLALASLLPIIPLGIDTSAAWPLGEVDRSGAATAAPTGFDITGPVWPEPVAQVSVTPINLPGEARSAAYLIVGVNPRRALDPSYRSFLEVAAGHISNGIAAARAYEEERRRAEALAEIDRAKTAFFSNVSHEFRTPLTLMLGPLEEVIAHTDRVPSAQREGLDLALRNARRLLRLVNSLLDFSRIEAGRVQANYRPTDLARLVADLSSSFRSATEKAGLGFVVDAAPLSQPAYVDRDMFETIVLNLLSNAFKFTFEGEIAVTLREEGGRARLTVRDTGSGIPEAELPRLFDRFHRVEGAKGRSFEGSGIGLALVQELVLQHGGDITVESMLGSGTAFTVSIPLGAAHLPSERLGPELEAAPAERRAKSFVDEALHWLPGDTLVGLSPDDEGTLSVTPMTDNKGQRQRVLLADDSADLRGYIKRLLVERGYEVEAVVDGEEALAAIRARRPDLVVADVMMPRLDGFGLLRTVRGDTELRDLPIIMLSARAGEEAKVEGLNAGADDYLTKPFSARELLARVAANIAMARVRREAAETVAASEARAGRVLAGMTEGYVLLDHEYRVIEINEEGLRLDGRPREDFIGRSHWDIWPGSETGAQGLLYKRVMEEGAPDSVESHYEWEDGHGAWFDVDAYPVPDGLAIFYRDVSVRKLSAQAVAASEERLRHALDAVQGVLWTNNASGEMDGEQPGWAALTGQTAEEYREFGWSKAVHPDDAQPTIDAWNAAVSERRTFVFEHRLRRRDGEWRRFSIQAVPTLNEDGAITQWVGVHTDITDQRAAEDRNRVFLALADRMGALSDSREMAGAAAEVIGRHLKVSRAGYGEVSADGETVAFETGYGEGVAPLVGAFPLEAFGVGNIDELRRGNTTIYADVAADPRTSDTDFAAIETRAAVAVPLIREGRLRAAFYLNHREVREWTPEEVALVQDVAARTWDALERARAEADLRELNATLEQRVQLASDERAEALARLHEAQKVETLGQLTGGVAHDFNNLLTPIMGGLEVLSSKLAHDERAQRIASGAMQSAERAKTLIQRLLTFGRRQTLQSRAIDIAGLVEGMRDLIERSIGPSVEIIIDIPDDLPALEADPNQLELALLNLCVNARDAMESGGRLTIAAALVGPANPDPECIAIRISDTGTGMDEATLARATEPFFTTKNVGQGTGLGLSMVYGLAAQSGGKFNLTSAPGVGTTAELVLPTAAAPANIPPLSEPLAIDYGEGTVLLVDDEELVRMSIADGLRDLGYKVVEAASAAGALQHLREGLVPNVLVTDHMMPGMTGATLAHEARKRLPGLPVLMVTGYANLRAEETRGLELLAKPFHRGDLATRIAALIDSQDGNVVRLLTAARPKLVD